MKPCIVCGIPGEDTRCQEHALKKEVRRDRVTRQNRARWKNLSARLRRLQPWCSWCLTGSDLTVDHIIPLEHGGDPYALTNLQVLCRSCNRAKGLTRGDAPAGVASPTPGKSQSPLHTPRGYPAVRGESP